MIKDLKNGDKLLCIEGNDYLKAGSTYTFHMYFGKDYLTVQEEKVEHMRWRNDRFIVSNKGII